MHLFRTILQLGNSTAVSAAQKVPGGLGAAYKATTGKQLLAAHTANARTPAE